MNKFFHVRPNLRLADIFHTPGDWEATIIETRLVGAGLSFQPFGLGVQRCKPFGQLRSKDGEGGKAAERRNVTRTGIVSDKQPGLIGELQ